MFVMDREHREYVYVGVIVQFLYAGSHAALQFPGKSLSRIFGAAVNLRDVVSGLLQSHRQMGRQIAGPDKNDTLFCLFYHWPM